MNIAFIIGQVSGGGAERVISVLANWFVKKGYNVNIIAIIKDDVSYELDSRVNYYYNKSKIKNKLIRVIQRYLFTRDKIKELNPDIIISFTTQINIYSILSLIGNKHKIIISERNDPNKDPESKITRVIRDKVYNLSDRFIFQTEDAKKYFNKKIQERSNIIPNPLKEGLPLRYDGIRKKEFVTVARLSKQKNLKMLIDAFKIFYNEHDEYKLKIYGEGPLRNEIQEYINKNNLNEAVTLMGFEKEVHNKIINSSAFILSSDYEGISNSMIEALAIGVPTICTDCPIGGARMFIDNRENGLLVPVGDYKALYEAMKEVVEDNNLSQKISKESVYIREKLSVENICSIWQMEINKLIKESCKVNDI